MRNMKNSGIEWIGEIPQDWEVERMRNIGVFSASGIDKKINSEEPLVKIINYTDVYGNTKMILNKKDYMIVSAPQDKISKNLVEEGDLIFTPSSETIEDIGVSALVNEQLENTSFSYHLLRFQFYKNINKEYKKYLCNNNYVQNYFSSRAVGSIRKTLNRNDFKELKVILPSVEEQELIADYLDSKVSEIDNIISKTKETIEEYKKYKQSVITEAVTKGLNPNVEMKDSGIEWIGEIPKDWNIIRLRFLCDICTGNKDTINKDENGLYPFYVRSPKVEKINSYSFDGEAILTAGDGVGAGKVFHYVNEKFDYHQRVYNLHNFDKSINARLLYYYLKENFYKEIEKGNAKSTVDSIRLNMLQNFPVVVPNNHQDDIIKYLDDNCNKIDSLISKKQNLITELEQYKKSLIYECVTGKKEVSPAYAD